MTDWGALGVAVVEATHVAVDQLILEIDVTIENNGLLQELRTWQTREAVLCVEMIASYGMPVGREVFETCVWLGRFVQAWWPGPHRFVYRKDVKLHLCGNVRAKDGNVRQALIDLLGAPGTKKAPGPTYRIHGDEWAALALAVTAADTMTTAQDAA